MKKATISILLVIASLSATTIHVPADQATIQTALIAASTDDTVLVQPGTYNENIFWPETSGIKLISAGDSSNTVIDGGGVSSVVYMNPQTTIIDSNTIIQGFEFINGGNATSGGGLFCEGSSPTLIDLHFTNNSASNGGGIFLNSSSNPTLDGITLSNNTASIGGGIFISSSNPIFTNVSVTSNSATSLGGGMYFTGSCPSLNNVSILDNSAVVGGGLYGTNSINPITAANVEIAGNFATADGGGMFLNNTDLNIEDASFIMNSAGRDGGGIYTEGYRGINLTLGSITGNSAGRDGGGVFSINPNEQVLVRVNITNNFANSNGGGVYLSNSGFALSSVSLSDNYANFGGGIYINNSTMNIENVNIARNSAVTGGGMYLVDFSLPITNINITNNFATSNGGGVYLSSGSPSILSSNIINNTSGVYNANNSNIIDIANNYWGHSSGPYHPIQNPTGLGDSTNIYVNIIPWLTEPDIVAPPIPAQYLSIIESGNDFLTVDWDPSPLGDFAGFKLYYDTDYSGYPYDNSIDVSTDTSYTLQGLSPGTQYFVAVTVYDTDGNESWYSNEVQASPQTAPIIGVNPTVINFSATLVGDTTSANFIIINTGTDILTITDILHSTENIEISANTFEIPVGEESSVSLQLIPTRYGLSVDTLLIQNNSFNNPNLSVPLVWFGDLPEIPVILSVDDIPNDQGGQIRVSFTGSKYDGYDESQEITSYSVWRHIDGENWDAVGMFNAVQDSIYNYVAPTLCDSTVEGICWSSFKVSAHTGDAEVYYFSDSLGGYSTDNIAPGVPRNLVALRTIEGIQLSWNGISEIDFQYFAIYRSIQSGFNPDTMNTYDYTTTDTVLIDLELEEPSTYYYKISAFDFSGNESGYSEQASATIVSVDGGIALPSQYALYQNYPNPFNPSTTIRYGLPEEAIVSLVIYDVRGQVVQTIASEHQSAGWYNVVWNGQTSDGRTISTGIYFAKLVAGDYSQVIKMLYLK